MTILLNVQIKKEGVRYRRYTIEILHQKFLADVIIECSISNFAGYMSKNVVKPRPMDRGTSLCKICLNPKLKVEALKDSKINLEVLLSLDDAQLKNWSDRQKKKKKLITCKEWQTEKVKN